MKTRMADGTKIFLSRLVAALAVVLFFTLLARAGGPKYVAGTSYFNSSSAGQPLVWAGGQVTYYTDQGNLSSILPNSAANSLVASAFSQWSAVPTAALAVTNPGQLAEDVSGANVILNADGTVSLPADIQPSSTGTPIGIVYDYDGSVTDDLLGAGAGGSSECFFNAVFGGVDNYGALANFEHALIVIDGQCAQMSSQITDVEYRLVRVIGSVLGLGWSQVNLNVLTNEPPATSDDYAGFPVMHFEDLVSCVPITRCLPNPYQLAADDIASVSRLYPVTTQKQSSFPGKQIFSAATARIHGSIWFANHVLNRTQPMQGVNVVARWIDPLSGLPSGRYAASSVSGFLFTGNAGNPVTGGYDPLGYAYSQFGSNDPAVEGFFDLSGLEFPGGATSAQYQLTVEALDPLWSTGVGPYTPYQVAPSGMPSPVTVTVIPGSDTAQDVVMPGSALPVPQWAASETWTVPAPVPAAGDWMGSLGGYGDCAYFKLPAQANRTLSVAVTALDELGNVSESKAQPVIGMWAASDPVGTPPPAYTSSSFNQLLFGLTRLDAQINTSTNFLVGIADLRGDGRPDYHYHAHVLYADSLSPSRVGVNGGAVALSGIGFSPALAVTIGSVNVAPLAVFAGQMILPVPAQSDGAPNITVTDPVSGAFSTMTGALTVGAASTDNLLLIQGANPPTPVGTQATNPMRVRAVASDGVTPVAGATIAWSANNGVALSVCGGAATCSTTTDASGYAATWLTPATSGSATITATLAPGAYSSSPSVAGSLTATSSSSDMGVTTPYLWIAQGASVSLPLVARVLNNGVPQTGATVNFNITSGTGSLSAGSAGTNSGGYATVTLTVAQFVAEVKVIACVAPGNAPCQPIYANPVAPSMLTLQPVAGIEQSTTLGQAFQPLTVRVTDSSSPPNPVLAASVSFSSVVARRRESLL